MTCDEAIALAGLYLDSEDEVGTPIANHVATCPNCARLLEQRRNWRRVVRQAPRFEARDPGALANRVRAAVASAAVMNAAAAATLSRETPKTDAAPAPAPPAAVVPFTPPVTQPVEGGPVGPALVRRSMAVAGWLTAAAALLVCGTLTLWMWSLTRTTGVAEVDLVARDVVSSHIRSLMAEHLTDVPSSDRHTVKPWFAGKVPYALNVPDPRGEGFALEGGRLDYVGGRSVAALVYRRRQHAINVFVWPLASTDHGENGTHTESGYDAIGWTARGQQHWAVSDLNVVELRQFVGLFQRDE